MNLQKGQAQAKLAIADQDTPSIHVYDARGGSNEPVASIQPHRAPVMAMRFNATHDSVISLDSKGIGLLEHSHSLHDMVLLGTSSTAL